ncbi:hypothetical protein EBU99_08905 [bacterium]|nr:hypothetical protein [bacterium]
MLSCPNIKRFACTFSLLFLAGNLGCKRIVDKVAAPQLPPPQTGQAEQLNPTLNISMDASLSAKEREFLKEDFRFLQGLRFDSKIEGYFVKAFSTSDGSGLMKYLDDRIGHIIGPDTTVDSRFSYTADTGSDSGKAVTIATNIGTAVWLETVAQRRNISFFTNNTAIPVNDPRVGIIKLGKAYTVFDDSGRSLNTVARTSVLIHEARHSDCTGGLTDRDVTFLATGQLPENRSCGHLHVICPSGNDYEGLPACDGKVWGAYAMGWLFANELSQKCQGCSESMLQTAMIVAMDSLSRLDKETARAMKAGVLEYPDMSSNPPKQ